MVRVDTVLKLVNFITNKETAGNTMKIDQYNTVIEAVNIDLLKQRYGLPEEYRAGQPMPTMSYEITKKIMDDMSQLKVRMGVDTPALTVNSFGRGTIPTNYLHLSSAKYVQVTDNQCENKKIKHRDIELLTDAQIAERLSNSIKMPTKKNPCMAQYGTYWQFYPSDLKKVHLTYLRLPNTPYYAYTIDEETDEYIFDETNSVNFEYPADCLTDIVRLVLTYVNRNLKELQDANFNELLKQQGA